MCLEYENSSQDVDLLQLFSAAVIAAQHQGWDVSTLVASCPHHLDEGYARQGRQMQGDETQEAGHDTFPLPSTKEANCSPLKGSQFGHFPFDKPSPNRVVY